MSLGWLTESALIPAKPVLVKGVPSGSLKALQAAVRTLEERGPRASLKRRREAAEATRNEGVDARRAQEEQDVADLSKGKRSEMRQAKLEEKARRYEAIMSGTGRMDAGELVDFQAKRAMTALGMGEGPLLAPGVATARAPLSRSAAMSQPSVCSPGPAPSSPIPEDCAVESAAVNTPCNVEVDGGEGADQSRGKVRDRLAALRMKRSLT